MCSDHAMHICTTWQMVVGCAKHVRPQNTKYCSSSLLLARQATPRASYHLITRTSYQVAGSTSTAVVHIIHR